MNPASDQAESDYFFDAYDRDDVAYGMEPSAALAAYLRQIGPNASPSKTRLALDLGAGAGRDTLALAAAGYSVTSVDVSQRGLDRIRERAERAGISDRVQTLACDVREVEFEPLKYDAVIATTVLDHIPADDARPVWSKMCESLSDVGMLYVQVHTTEDPGSDRLPGKGSDRPVSETAGAVINYFAPNQLVSWACETAANLRVLRYEERLEWDTTHGNAHEHGKAILLAVRSGFHPDWFGQPAAFPRP